MPLVRHRAGSPLLAAVAGSISGSELAVIATVSMVGGVAIGVVGGLLARWLMNVFVDPLFANALVLILPFALFVAAEAVEASGFLAVVVRV